MSEQRKRLLQLLIEYCNQQKRRSFTLSEINTAFQNYDTIKIGGKTPQATVRRLLQELRDEKVIRFIDNMGTYTLGGDNLDFLLEEEEKELHALNLSNEPSHTKKEYLRETYLRNTTMVQLAKKTFGHYCLFPSCENTFSKADLSPYIEVHHIIPLYKGGPDILENLSVLCAHHHRMAHFADQHTQYKLEKILLHQTSTRLGLV